MNGYSPMTVPPTDRPENVPADRVYDVDVFNLVGIEDGWQEAIMKLNDPDLTVTIHAGDAKAFYAAFVEFGTTGHKIEAKLAPALHLYGSGYVESVNHPGAAARPFFYPAWRLVKKKAKGRISRATNKAAKKVAAGA